MYCRVFGPGFPRVKESSSRVSRPVYLHFLDRQLLTTLRLYGLLPVSAVRRDFLLVLASTYEALYLSAAMILENVYADQIFKDYRVLFRGGHIELVITEGTIPDYAIAKRHQYRHVKDQDQFRPYFSDGWRRLADVGPAVRRREHDTGASLEEAIVLDLGQGGIVATGERLGEIAVGKKLEGLAAYAIDALQVRRGKAITGELYELFCPKIAQSEPARRVFSFHISERYVASYIAEYAGTICTGLTMGLGQLDYLCPVSPSASLATGVSPAWDMAVSFKTCPRPVAHTQGQPRVHRFYRRDKRDFVKGFEGSG